MELSTLALLFAKAFLLGNLVMLTFALMTWIERRAIAFFQYRPGPNRVGPFGILQPIADLIKLVRKENFSPGSISVVLFLVAPIATLFFALMTFAVVPFGDPSQEWGPLGKPFIAADMPIAVLFAVAMSGLGGYGVIVGGWNSNSKFALLGALRACAQLISYEVAMTLAVLPIVMMAGSLSMVDIVLSANAWSFLGLEGAWFILWAPLGFVIFFIAALAEANRAPFDHAEAEQELVAGFHTEYGGLRYAAFANAEYLHMIAISSIGVTFFLGGWTIPFVETVPWWAAILSFLLKLSLMLFVFIWIRATVPRLRYDRLMRMGWKVMLPLATVQFLITAAIVAGGWGRIDEVEDTRADASEAGIVEASEDAEATLPAPAPRVAAITGEER